MPNEVPAPVLKWTQGATEPPADPCDEALAQVTAERAALEKGMRELLAVRKPTEEHNREYCRLKANHVAVLKKQAEVGQARVEPMASPWLTLWEANLGSSLSTGGKPHD